VAELAVEDLEEEVKWLVKAKVRLVMVHLETLEMTIHQLARMDWLTIHQSLAVWCWWVVAIHWRLMAHCHLMVAEVVYHPQDHP